MANPLLDAMMAQRVSAMDPMKMLESNPQTAKYAELLKGGKDPKELFYELCRERGVSPDMVLSLVKGVR